MMNYDKVVDEIREFNRFYTVNMGFLDSNYLDSSYSIAEMRILFELKSNDGCIQNDIVKLLHIDKSYLSRLINRLCKRQLVEKQKSESDRRAANIMLTEKGIAETDRLIALTNHRIALQILELSSDECGRLCEALYTVMEILGKEEI